MASGGNAGTTVSTGRGGAGNIGDASKSPRLNPTDLTTPTLKTSVYTTGRGGSGNMVTNDDPESARLAQDVGPIIEKVPSASEKTHVGRGGEGNITTVGEKDKTSKADGKDEKPAPKGLAAMAKDFFKK